MEHKREINQSMFYGTRNYTSPGISGGTEPRGHMGGLFEYITTNKSNLAGTLSYTTLETNMRRDLQYGNTDNKVIFASPLVSQVFGSYSITAWTRTDPGDVVWGVHPTGLLNSSYGANTPVFVHKPWNLLQTATGTGGWGGAYFVVDLDGVRLRWTRPTQLLRSRQQPSQDQQIEEYLSELSMEVRTEQKHAFSYAITG